MVPFAVLCLLFCACFVLSDKRSGIIVFLKVNRITARLGIILCLLVSCSYCI